MRFKILIPGLLTLCLQAPELSSKPHFAWPKPYRCAVSLTYDDALPSQLSNALPALEKAGFKATFFLPGDMLAWKKSKNAWAEVAAKGHEIGNHSMHHPCAREAKVNKAGFAAEDYSAARIAAEMDEAQALLGSLSKGAKPLVYAYPCGQDSVGDPALSYVPEVAKRFVAARGVRSDIADPLKVDLMHVPGVAGDQGAQRLLKALARARARGAWVVFLFHGVGGNFLRVDAAAHEQLLKALADPRSKCWVAPFGQVAQWVKERR